MHDTSFNHMKNVAEKYLDKNQRLQVIDIGSSDVNGSYKPIFEHPHWQYRGVDLSPGHNVDIVLESPYNLPMEDESIDVLVSGQAFEHIEFFWLTWAEVVRVLKPGGYVFIIAPSRGPEHRYPVDCWRFYPDGFRALAKLGGVELKEVSTDWVNLGTRNNSPWGDTLGVFYKKPAFEPEAEKPAAAREENYIS